MSIYYCPYCPDINSCMHELRYIVEETEPIYKDSVKRKNDLEENINLITFKFKKIKVNKKISFKRCAENIDDYNISNKRIKLISKINKYSGIIVIS